MNRQEKAEVIGSLKEAFSASQAVFLVGYRGLTVEQVQDLRGKLRENGGNLRVAKVTLMRRAFDVTDDFTDELNGQIGAVFVSGDPAAVAKEIHGFAKGNDKLKVSAGYYGSKMIDSQSVKVMAELPPREVIMAGICHLLESPARSIASSLNAPATKLVWILGNMGEKKE